MGVLVLLVVIVVTWESKANSSSTDTGLQTGTELGNTRPVENFWTNISKCYSFSETMAYFLALIVDFSSSY